MAEAVKKDITNILEGTHEMQVSREVDLTVLNSASKYAVDLQKLEALPVKKEPEVDSDAILKRQEEGWATLDVKLLDIVNMVFDRADYPIFIVQDDFLVYVNQVVRKLLHIGSEEDILHRRFLELVYKDDWNLLANNIGEMLTTHKKMTIKFNDKGNRIQELNLRAVYISDIEHFSFILLGESEHNKKSGESGSLYDDATGLPTFFLFEDRLQMAVLAMREDKNALKGGIAVLAININNMNDFKKINFNEAAIKRLADNLVFNLPKTVTVSKGLKYHFWILLSGLKDNFELDYYIRRVKEVLDGGISDNFMRHDLHYSIGYSVFPDVSHTAKELIEHTIAAVRKSQSETDNSIVMYKRKS